VGRLGPGRIAQRSDAAVARVTTKLLIERMSGDETLDEGVFDGAGERGGCQDGREVEQRALRRRDGDSLVAGGVGGVQSLGAMDPHLGRTARVTADDGHVDRAARWHAHSAQHGGGLMTQQRPIAQREHSRHRRCVRRVDRTDDEDAAIAPPQPPAAHSSSDVVPGQPAAAELTRGHHAALARRDRERGPLGALRRHNFPIEPRRERRWEEVPPRAALLPAAAPAEGHEGRNAAPRGTTSRRSPHPPAEWEEMPPPPETDSLTSRRSMPHSAPRHRVDAKTAQSTSALALSRSPRATEPTRATQPRRATRRS